MALSDNLVAYWKLDETTGTSVTESINSISTTATNTENGDWGAAKINNGLTCDGSDEYVSVAQNAVFSFSGSFSINCWVKTNDDDGCIVAKDHDSGTAPRNWEMNLAGGKLNCSVFIGGVQKEILDTVTDVSNDAFHMVTMIFTAVGAGTSTLKSYVDTVETSATLTNLNAVVDYLAGTLINFCRRSYTGSNNYLAAQIDEVGIWSKALSAGEMTTLYNGGSGLQYPFAVSYTATPSALAMTAAIATQTSIVLVMGEPISMTLTVTNPLLYRPVTNNVTEGPGGIGSRTIANRYPITEGRTLGTTKLSSDAVLIPEESILLDKERTLIW